MNTAFEQRRPHKPDNASLGEAIRLAQQRDGSAFEFLYRLYCGRVYALCLRMVRDASEAEDLTQEAFLRLFRKIHTFRGESAFSTWLHRVTTNVVLMHLRKKKLMTMPLDDFLTTDEDNGVSGHELGAPDLRMTGMFDRANLQMAIDQLPDRYKAAFLLHDVQGYEHTKIAKILGCSVGTSKSQLHRARKRLREILESVHHFLLAESHWPSCCATVQLEERRN